MTDSYQLRFASERRRLRVCAELQHDADASVPLHLRIRIRGNGIRVEDKAIGTSSDGSAALLGSSRETDTADQLYGGMVIGSSGADRSSQQYSSGQSLNAQEAVSSSDARPSLASNGLRVSQGLAAVAGSRANDAPKGKEAKRNQETRRLQPFGLLGSSRAQGNEPHWQGHPREAKRSHAGVCCSACPATSDWHDMRSLAPVC